MTEPITRFWEQTVGHYQAECWYIDDGFIMVQVIDIDDHRKVTAERFVPAHEPKFGLDVEDAARSKELAEKLTLELESRDGAI